jgi:TPR repeat protein
MGQYGLGLLLKDGIGCEKNEAKALENFIRSAELGYTASMVGAGRLLIQSFYRPGGEFHGISGNARGELRAEIVPCFEQAFCWLKKATEQRRVFRF